jgi:hypothetical protein
MKPLFYIPLFIILLFISIAAFGQRRFDISGKVSDEKGLPVKGATVFVSGSQKVTTTDDEGKFIFYSVDAGTYQLMVQLLGYYPHTENVLVQVRPVDLDIALKVKTIMLSTVKIGGDGNWAKNYEIFKAQFLGSSDIAKQCKILNPEVLSFGSVKKVLTAEADEFLIIENKQLGYRIHYLLKDFQFNPANGITKYDGDTNFELLTGPEKIQAIWEKNRLKAYNGSLMHFLRALYSNKVLEEGFITNQLYSGQFLTGVNLYADPRPVKFDTIVTVIDTSFISAKFTSLYVSFDKKKAASLLNPTKADTVKKQLVMDPAGSIVKLYLKEAIIDSKGSCVDYRTFLLQGIWGRRRIGDLLPFEYQPAAVAN